MCQAATQVVRAFLPGQRALLLLHHRLLYADAALLVLNALQLLEDFRRSRKKRTVRPVGVVFNTHCRSFWERGHQDPLNP